MTKYCEEGIKLTKEFFSISSKQSENDHCCNPDECCGDDECGEDCCEISTTGFGAFCTCAEPQRERSKKEDKAWDKAYTALDNHRDNCKQCKDTHEGK